MNRLNDTTLVEHYPVEIDLSDPRVIQKLVSSLMYLFQFSAKAELAFILGYPTALNNQQALINWMTDQLKQADWIEPSELLDFFVTRLKRELQHWQEVA